MIFRKKYFGITPPSIAFVLASALLLQCSITHAELGAAPTDFGRVQNGLKAHSFSTAVGNYQVIESTLPSGTVVREYVTLSGIVFAVSWNGPFLPDLRSLLGKHFNTLTTEAAKRPKAGHSQIGIERPDAVIISGGHMRAYAGRAWAISALPSGFNTNDIE